MGSNSLKTLFVCGCVLGGAGRAPAQLVIGTAPLQSTNPADTNNGIWHVDVTTGVSTQLYSDIGAWGMTSDDTGRVWFTSNDGGLYSFDLGDAAPTFHATVNPTEPLPSNETLQGLAFVDDTLYGWEILDSNNNPGVHSGLYSLDTLTGTRTYIGDINESSNIAGIDADPATGIVYGVNDATRMLATIDLVTGASTDFAPYPVGRTDIDGLAAGNGKLYLVEDQNEPIHVFDIASGTYDAPIPTPFANSDIFSGAAFIVPEPGSLSLLVLCGVVLLCRRR